MKHTRNYNTARAERQNILCSGSDTRWHTNNIFWR